MASPKTSRGGPEELAHVQFGDEHGFVALEQVAEICWKRIQVRR